MIALASSSQFSFPPSDLHIFEHIMLMGSGQLKMWISNGSNNHFNVHVVSEEINFYNYQLFFLNLQTALELVELTVCNT